MISAYLAWRRRVRRSPFAEAFKDGVVRPPPRPVDLDPKLRVCRFGAAAIPDDVMRRIRRLVYNFRREGRTAAPAGMLDLARRHAVCAVEFLPSR